MALYKVSVKIRHLSQGMEVRPGMYVEISSIFHPLMPPVINQVNQLFLNKYGIDLKRLNMLDMANLHAEKLS